LNKAFQDAFDGSKKDLIALHELASDEDQTKEICYRWGGDQDLALQWLEQSVT
jgi:energy-converting hydrogenase A subunit M